MGSSLLLTAAISELETIHIVGALLLAPWLFFFLRATYLLTLHPLAGYPGPKLWAISRVPWHWVGLKGELARTLMKYHQKYGPVIRVAPDELSYTSSTAWKKIYGQNNPEFLKCLDGRGIAPPNGPNGERSIVTEVPERHAVLRRALLPAFSDRALREQEQYLQRHSNSLVTQLQKHSSPLDMAKWLHLTSFDVVSELAFGEPTGSLERAGDPWLDVLAECAKSIPVIQAAVHYNLMWALNWLASKEAVKARKKHIELAKAKIARCIDVARNGDPHSASKRDFVSYVLDNKVENVTSGELCALSSALVTAGSNTTAYGMTATLYFVCKNPRVHKTLASTLRSAFVRADDISVARLGGECKYLRACIEEALRFSPPLPSTSPRWVPEPGQEIEGKFVPAGIAVGVHSLAATHASWNFHRADDFLPERWIERGDPKSVFANDDLAASQAFSYGRHDCIGRNLAMNEMMTVLAKLFWAFDFTLQDESQSWWEHSKTYLVWSKPPLIVSLRDRNTTV